MFRSRALWAILAAGLALRLIYGLAQDPLMPYGQTGGDDPWYLANALALVTDAPSGSAINGFPVNLSTLNQPPVFFLAAGIPQTLLPPGPAVQALRFVQALATTAVALFACGLAFRLVGGLPNAREPIARRAGLIAAAALALSPALILESAQIKTESLFLFFVAGGIWAFVEAVTRRKTPTHGPLPEHREGVQNTSNTPGSPLPEGEGKGGRATHEGPEMSNFDSAPRTPHSVLPLHAARWFIVAGVLLGLATLTRAVFLAFPLALVVFTPLALGWRPGWKHALLLLVVYSAVVLSWTAWNLVRYQRFLLAGDGLASFVYLGATGWEDPDAVDERLDEALGPSSDGSRDSGEFLEAAGSSILADLPGYLARRVGELGGALLQPHNVEVFQGESLRALLRRWWTGERDPAGPAALLDSAALFRDERLIPIMAGQWPGARTPGGLAAFTRADAFWPKLLLYVVHYGGWILAALGLLFTWRNWRTALPMLGYIGYLLLTHLVLLALPRYLFPMTPFVWVFAAAAIAVMSSTWNSGKRPLSQPL